MHRKLKDLKLADCQIHTEADYIFNIIVRLHACSGLLVMHSVASAEESSWWMCECSPGYHGYIVMKVSPLWGMGNTDVCIIAVFPFPFPAL